MRGGWVRRGADWLLGEMLLFFIPGGAGGGEVSRTGRAPVVGASAR
ncbi:hypothetical protein ACU4GD_19515 [Cupriavidus basilensis]